MTYVASHTLAAGQAAEIKLKETVASYMSASLITLRRGMKAGDARAHMLGQLRDDDVPAQIFVTDDSGFLHGRLSLKTLLTERNDARPVCELMQPIDYSVEPGQLRRDVAPELQEKSPDTVPVVRGGKLAGALYGREIASLIRDEETDDAQRQGASLPLDTPYLATSPWALWKKRLPWLLLLFAAEAYTSTILQVFEEQLEAVIALAFFIPLLIGTGGNSGTQITSTLVRAMAVGEVGLRNLAAVLRKEVTTSVMIALAIGLVGLFRAWMLGVGNEVALVVCLTLVAITVWSAIVSSIIPMVLKKMRIDPAVVSAPFIATFIDGTGLVIYFNIAKLVIADLA
ncbi:magnesium transporter [Chromobacterium violaceum]|uniref:Magnesium transporter mgtE n=1 Tax=Chromobacterium violaceum TaxID=536 RepID=A0AAX2M5E3_CHRVL|nr:magnesium transporter [Chromobacterium violaceum]OLZ83826.1 magnesium transporter [Chromobacterium violaceum]STB71911.1 Magnesium transporter mgtE [Chromobacterium violaceum]SUX31620.1 Magnesium transporter mgtE [Chromobacterium violaceum]